MGKRNKNRGPMAGLRVRAAKKLRDQIARDKAEKKALEGQTPVANSDVSRLGQIGGTPVKPGEDIKPDPLKAPGSFGSGGKR